MQAADSESDISKTSACALLSVSTPGARGSYLA